MVHAHVVLVRSPLQRRLAIEKSFEVTEDRRLVGLDVQAPVLLRRRQRHPPDLHESSPLSSAKRASVAAGTGAGSPSAGCSGVGECCRFASWMSPTCPR